MTREVGARRVLLAAALMLLGGCASAPPAGLQCNLSRYVVPVPEAPGIQSQLVHPTSSGYRPPVIGPEERFSVLALSAGGEYGAYSTGFLHGWSDEMKKGTGSFAFGPESFTVVTGISAGAVVATHVFTGKFDEIDSIYPNLSAGQLYEKRGFLGLLSGNSVFRTSGKDRLLERYITDETLEDVVKASKANRRKLFIGTVDIHDGRFLDVDMTALAASDEPNRLKCYQEVVSAAAAIPIAFEPKFIDDFFLVDGATRHALFFPRLEEDAKGAATRSLVAIVNQDLTISREPMENGLLPIALRTIEIGTDESAKDSVYRLDAVARRSNFLRVYADAVSASQQAECVEARNSCVQDGDTLHGQDYFCTPFMRCLSKHGYQDGRKAAQGWWQLGLPLSKLGSGTPPQHDACYKQVADIPADDPCER